MNMTVREFEKMMVNDLNEYCENCFLCSDCMFLTADETKCIRSDNYDIDDLLYWYSLLLKEHPDACSIPYDEFFKMAAPLTGTDVTITNYEDLVNHPIHYTHGGIECWDAMLAAYGHEQVKIYAKINCFKYLFRMDNKGGIVDAKKALWYLRKYIELEEQANE